MKQKEQWKVIMQDNRYEISNFGRVRNRITGHMLSCKPTKSHRHPQAFLIGNQRGRLQLTVSHLVYEHFCYGKQLDYGVIIGHKDGNIKNNNINNLYVKNK